MELHMREQGVIASSRHHKKGPFKPSFIDQSGGAELAYHNPMMGYSGQAFFKGQ